MKALILQVFYQPEGVSLRFYPQPEANAFRLIQPNRCNNYYLFNLVSGTLSNALRLIPVYQCDKAVDRTSNSPFEVCRPHATRP